jgi:hypothetical protein
MMATKKKNNWGKTPCKNWPISTLDKVNCFKGTLFQGSTKPYKIGWRLDEKNYPLFSNILLSLDFYGADPFSFFSAGEVVVIGKMNYSDGDDHNAQS